MKSTTTERLMAQAQEYLDEEHDSEVLKSLRDDHARFDFCWKRAVYFRTAWLDGQRSLVASTLASTNARYANVSRSNRIKQAKMMWCASVEARDLAETEREWHRWALGYLAAWQAETMSQLTLTLSGLVGVLRDNGR